MNNNVTNQNVNYTKEKIILDILKNDSSFINDLTKSITKLEKSKNKLKQKITRINFICIHNCIAISWPAKYTNQTPKIQVAIIAGFIIYFINLSSINEKIS